MRLLGLSSATKVISFGLIDEAKVLVEATIADNQSEKLLFFLAEAGVRPEQIEAIAVASGPGSYSGLRGGVTAAKSLAQTLNIPLIGVSTLDAVAYNLIDIEGTMAVVLAARADEYNFALFGASGGVLKRLTDDLVLKVDGLIGCLRKITGEIWVVGDLESIRGHKRIMKRNVHWADEIHCHPYGVNVAELGLAKIKAGQSDDPLTLVPEYSHQPIIREYKQ